MSLNHCSYKQLKVKRNSHISIKLEEIDNHLKKLILLTMNGQITDSLESLTNFGIKDVHIRIEN